MVVVLFRNLAAALITIVPDEALQLFLLPLAHGPPFIICTAVLPWRIAAANNIDLATNIGFVLVLFLGTILADAATGTLIAWVLTVLPVFPLERSLCSMLVLSGRKYEFFLCRHKQGSGGFARLLKMRLSLDPRVKRRVFLDSDELQDLDQLFGFVGNHADTLVVLCTSSISSRPWCVGKMTTAKLHGVDTIRLVFSDFQ